MKKRSWNFWLLVLFLVQPVLVLATPYQQLFVFGDSLSDNGNAAVFTLGQYPGPLYDPLRFSNGPVAVEGLAAHLGLGLSPAVLGGTNYALGGATTGTANYVGVPNAGIVNEVVLFALIAPAFDPANTLFVVWGGPNDFLINPAPATVNQAADQLALDIAALAMLGAQHFLVPNMADLGLTPFGLSFGDLGAQYLSAVSAAFNQRLEQNLLQLEQALLIDLIRFDTFGFMQQAVLDPGAFGFTNVTEPCLLNGQVCADPTGYLFWDDVHPTTYAHQMIGAGLAAAVPEPAAITLMLFGGLVLYRLNKAGTIKNPQLRA